MTKSENPENIENQENKEIEDGNPYFIFAVFIKRYLPKMYKRLLVLNLISLVMKMAAEGDTVGQMEVMEKFNIYKGNNDLPENCKNVIKCLEVSIHLPVKRSYEEFRFFRRELIDQLHIVFNAMQTWGGTVLNRKKNIDS